MKDRRPEGVVGYIIVQDGDFVEEGDLGDDNFFDSISSAKAAVEDMCEHNEDLQGTFTIHPVMKEVRRGEVSPRPRVEWSDE